MLELRSTNNVTWIYIYYDMEFTEVGQNNENPIKYDAFPFKFLYCFARFLSIPTINPSKLFKDECVCHSGFWLYILAFLTLP